MWPFTKKETTPILSRQGNRNFVGRNADFITEKNNEHCHGGDHASVHVGNYAMATTGDFGVASSKNYGVSFGGVGATCRTGHSGVMLFLFYDKENRPRIHVLYVGENGILPNTDYWVNEDGEVVVVGQK